MAPLRLRPATAVGGSARSLANYCCAHYRDRHRGGGQGKRGVIYWPAGLHQAPQRRAKTARMLRPVGRAVLCPPRMERDVRTSAPIRRRARSDAPYLGFELEAALIGRWVSVPSQPSSGGHLEPTTTPADEPGCRCRAAAVQSKEALSNRRDAMDAEADQPQLPEDLPLKQFPQRRFRALTP